MSINLLLEKKESTDEEQVPTRYTKRIDDLIEDAEIEAEIEAERKVRAKNTKILGISALAVGLLVSLYFGIQSRSENSAPATVASPEIANAGLKPKPIPFPVNDKVKAPAPTGAVLKTPASKPKEPVVKKAPAPKPVAQVASKPKVSKPVTGGTTLKSLGLPASNSLKEPKTPKAVKPAPKPAPKAAVAPVVNSPTGSYYVQVGAFSVQANAQRLADKLKNKGFNSATMDKKSIQSATGPKQVFVVKVADLASKSVAQSTQTSLKKAGFKSTMIGKTS